MQKINSKIKIGTLVKLHGVEGWQKVCRIYGGPHDANWLNVEHIMGSFQAGPHREVYKQSGVVKMTMTKQPTMKKLILTGLKQQGLHTIVNKIVSIRTRHYSSVTVETRDLFDAEHEVLNNFLSQFRAGRFDGMIDCYEFKKDRHERAVNYINISNEFSEAVKSTAKKELAEKWGIVDDATAFAKYDGYYYDQVIRKFCNKLVA